MQKTSNISLIFPRHLFWDMDFNSLNVNQDLDIIIPRALYMTNRSTFENDIRRLERVYSSNQIVEQLKNTKEKISNEVCELVANRYSVPVFHRFSKR